MVDFREASPHLLFHEGFRGRKVTRDGVKNVFLEVLEPFSYLVSGHDGGENVWGVQEVDEVRGREIEGHKIERIFVMGG